jgi:hypothetical protein
MSLSVGIPNQWSDGLGHLAESINLVMESGERQIGIGWRSVGVAEIFPRDTSATGPAQRVISVVEML